MRLLPLPQGGVRLRFDFDEAQLLEHLTGQLIALLQSHSSTSLDPDPLFASLEVGGSDELPNDPALARMFPNAFENEEDAAQFRRVTEQGLVNRKLQDALDVTSELGLGGEGPSAAADTDSHVEVEITAVNMSAWVRTLTSLRLAIAARLGIESQEHYTQLLAEKSTHSTALVYDWLGAILDSVLRILDS